MAEDHNAGLQVAKIMALWDGRLQSSSTTRWGEVCNPSTGRGIAKVPLCTAADVDRTVQAAVDALPAGAEMPVIGFETSLVRY